MRRRARSPLGMRLRIAMGLCCTFAGVNAQLTGTDKDIPPWTPGATTMQRSAPLTDIDPNAVCMDGSPASYYFSSGSGSGANTFLVFLQGGFWCDGQQNCQQRYQQSHFMASSTGWSQLYALEGIFSDDANLNPSFYNANLVFLKYCSGDAWMGDASAFGYQFRGRAIVNATVTALVQQHGLSNGDHFLFGGCSAGGAGALANIDSISRLLYTNGVTSLRFGGFFDASGWPDIPQPPWLANDNNAATPLVQSVQQLAQFINPSIPPDCAAANQGQEYLCIYPSVRLQYVETPYLLNAAQFDSFYFDYTLSGAVPTGQSQIAWAETYQQATLDVFSDLPSTASIFSTACEGHCLALNTTFTALDVNGVSLAAVLAYWFFDDAGGTGSIRNIDPCVGWGCTNRCSGGLWSPQNSVCNAPSAAEQIQMGYSPSGGGTGPYCGTPGAVPAATATKDAQAAIFVKGGRVANLASSFSVLSKPTSGTTATNEADSTADGSPADVVSSETSGTAPNTVAAKGRLRKTGAGAKMARVTHWPWDTTPAAAQASS